MMRGILLTFLLITQITGILNAQDLPRVGVPLFDHKESNNLNLDNHVTELVLDLLQRSGRYTVVDMTSEAQRKAALDRAAENYKAENWLEQNKAMNAEIILGGEITSIKFVRQSSTTQPGYRAAITMTLKLIDVESSRILASQSFSSSQSDLRLTPETSLASAMESLNDEILQFFRNHIRLQFAILKVTETKRDKVVSIVVRIPTNLDFQPGNKMALVLLEEIGGDLVPNRIGEIRLDRLISQDYWQASVRKGGEILFQNRDKLHNFRCAE